MGLYSGGAYIWNEVSVSTCGGLIHGGGAYIRGGGAYSRRFTVINVLYLFHNITKKIFVVDSIYLQILIT